MRKISTVAAVHAAVNDCSARGLRPSRALPGFFDSLFPAFSWKFRGTDAGSAMVRIHLREVRAFSVQERKKDRPFPVVTIKRTCISASPFGADDRIRTGDLILTKDALYRLSYISMSFDNIGIVHHIVLIVNTETSNLTNRGRAGAPNDHSAFRASTFIAAVSSNFQQP